MAPGLLCPARSLGCAVCGHRAAPVLAEVWPRWPLLECPAVTAAGAGEGLLRSSQTGPAPSQTPESSAPCSLPLRSTLPPPPCPRRQANCPNGAGFNNQPKIIPREVCPVPGSPLPAPGLPLSQRPGAHWLLKGRQREGQREEIEATSQRQTPASLRTLRVSIQKVQNLKGSKI